MEGLDLIPPRSDERPLMYLATPYSHENKGVMWRRFEAVNAATAELMQEGVNVFSPITHSHLLAQKHGLPEDWGFWKRVDEEYISVSRAVLVFQISGWRDSTGVSAEREIANEQGVPVLFLNGDASCIAESPHNKTTTFAV